jgi:hypothetical protein
MSMEARGQQPDGRAQRQTSLASISAAPLRAAAHLGAIIAEAYRQAERYLGDQAARRDVLGGDGAPDARVARLANPQPDLAAGGGGSRRVGDAACQRRSLGAGVGWRWAKARGGAS